ncbi:MAG: hypothetical protein ACI4BB_08915 [Coprococcus sp.]
MRSGKPYKDRDREMIRKQWSSFSLTEKCQYIWFYYKVYLIVGIILTVFAIFLIEDIREKNPDEAFYVMVLDHELDEERIMNLQLKLAAELNVDSDTAECVIETAYSGSGNAESAATVSAYMQAGRVDLLIAPEEKFNMYASTGYLKPLSLPEYGEILQNVDKSLLFYATEVDYSQGGAVRNIPFNPHEQTSDSECYGIYLTDGEFAGMVLGIMVNCSHEEQVTAGVRFFLK